MPFVSYGFTDWESSTTIDSLATDIRDDSRKFNDHVSEAYFLWRTIPFYYKGDSDQDLYEGLSPASDLAESIQTYGDQVAKALENFSTDLSMLEKQKTEYNSSVYSFNSLYSLYPYDELDLDLKKKYDDLVARGPEIQQKYELLIDDVVAAMGALSIENFTTAVQGQQGTQSWLESVMGRAAGAKGEHPYLFEGLVTVLKGQNFQKTTTRTDVHETKHGKNGEVVEKKTTQRGRVRVRNTSHIFGTDLWQSKGGIFSIFARDITRARAQARRTHAERKAHYKKGLTNGLTWSANNFAKNFAANLPLADLKEELKSTKKVESKTKEVKETKDGKKIVVEEVKITQENKMSKAVRVGGKLTGPVGIAFDAKGRYEEEKQKNIEKLRKENPEMSDEEIEKEAESDAAANVTGQMAVSVTSGMAAGAAAGAALGSIVPGAGTVVGGLIGAGAGALGSFAVDEIAIFSDSDGDGEKESVSERAGNTVEKITDNVQEGVEKAKDKLEEAKEKAAGFFKF